MSFMACTDFCRAICDVRGKDGHSPTLDELIELFNLRDDGYEIGTVEQLELRPDCPFCRLVLKSCLETGIEGAEEIERPQRQQLDPIHMVVLPGEHCIRLSHPSQIGTRLMFVQEEKNDIDPTRGPSLARLVQNQQAPVSLSRSWLQQCIDHHGDTCSHLPRDLVSGDENLPTRQILTSMAR